MLLSGIVISLFVGLLTTVAFSDIQKRIIPNKYCIALLVLWPLELWLTAMTSGATGSADLANAMIWQGWQGLGLGLASFLVGALLFTRGGLGGGDVKLLSVVGMWAGPKLWFPFILMTALAGGILGLVVLARAVCINGIKRRVWRELTLPYGVAIACGGLYVAASLPHG